MPLHRREHHLRPPPRTTDPDERRTIERSLSSLLVGDVPDCHAFCHGTTFRDQLIKVVDTPYQRCRSRH